MKKLLASIILSSILLTNAHAGFGIGVAATASKIISEYNGRDNTDQTVPYIVAGVGIMFASGLIVAITNGGDVIAPWGFFFFLDAEGNLSQSNLETALKVKYSFLDNSEVVTNLSKAMKEKYELTREDMVSLNESELIDILAPADLSEKQTQLIINDLK